MRGYLAPGSSDIEGLFMRHRGWSVEAAKQARTTLLGHRDALRIRSARRSEPLFRAALPPGLLYWVLQGRVSAQWESDGDRQVSLVVCDEGDVFNEVQCTLIGVPIVNTGLHATAVPSRSCRITRVLEVPVDVVAALLLHQAVHQQLASIALLRTRLALTRLVIERLYEPALVVAWLCVSPSCGTKQSLDPDVRCLGLEVTVQKVITFAELQRLTGFAYGTVRSALADLEHAGYIQTDRDTVNATHLEIPDAGRLARAIEECDLTFSAS